jgi:hypothetical protein
VGGVIGVIVLLAAVALFYILFYQRHGGVYEYRSVDPKDFLEAGT